MRNVVGRGDEIDIMASLSLEIQHDFGQFFRSDFFTMAEVAYVIILAEDAAEVTVGEEYRSRAIPSHQRRFLSEMGEGT